MPDSKDYQGIARTTLDCLKKDLETMGVRMPSGDSGEIEYQGVKLSFIYSETDQKLTAQIMAKPAFIPAAMVWQLLDNKVQKCAGG